MQKTTTTKPVTKPYVAPGRSNAANRRTGASVNRNTSTLNRGKAPAKAAQKSPPLKEEPPKIDTRTAEEVDASYRANVARFRAAQEKFNEAYERKIEEFKAHLGARMPAIPPPASEPINSSYEEKKSDESDVA